MLNGQAPCARSSGAVLRLSCVLRACPALAGTTTSEALASSAIEGAQHLVRHDRVEDRLPLSRMEVERARLAGVFAEPPTQQLRRRGRDQVVQADGAVFQALAELPGLPGKASAHD